MYGRNTQYQDGGQVLDRLVRFGTVTDVDNEKRIARVMYPDLKDAGGQALTSDWLPVLINRDFMPGYGAAQRTEYDSGGSGFESYASHSHGLTIRPYMPKVNDQVVVLYEAVRNGRGVILGGIQSWQS